VNLVDALLDPDYFMKAVDVCLKNRFGFSESELIKNEEQKMKAKEEEKKRINDLIKELGKCDKISYLEKMVYPVLYPGLMMLDKERPEDPLTSLAIFLLQNKHLCDTPANLIYTGTNEEEEQNDPEKEEDKEEKVENTDNKETEETEIKEVKEKKSS
jgi:hypothetical protein